MIRNYVCPWHTLTAYIDRGVLNIFYESSCCRSSIIFLLLVKLDSPCKESPATTSVLHQFED